MNHRNKNLLVAALSKIVGAYVKNTILPKVKFPRQFFLCPVGPIGAGKSTTLKKLAKKIPMVIVSADDFRKILKKSGRGYEAAAALTLSAARHFASQGFSVALDMNCGRADKKRQIDELAGEFGAKIIWIRVNPPERYILDKLKNFKHTWLFRDAEHAIENYYHYKKILAEENFDASFLCTIDPSSPNFENQIDDAAWAIKNYLLNR